MKLRCLLANAILLTLLEVHTGYCQDDKGKSDLDTAASTSELHERAFNINSQIGADTSGLDEYEDDSDDLEIQASEHEIEAVYSPSGAALDPQDKPKKPKRRRRRRKRRKRIRTSTSSYEDVEEKNSDLGDLPAPAQDLPAPPEVLSYPKRRPSKRRRKTTTPIPIEEEYLLTAKKATAVPSIPPSHMPENIEEIIEQEPPQDTLKIKEKINSVPPVLVIPTESASPLLIPLPTVMTLLPKNITKLEESHPVPVNFSQSLTPDLLTPHGKQNKINVRLSEPILFVTAPQAADYVELPEATPPPPVRTVPSKPTTTASTVNVVTSTTPKIPVVVTSTTQPTKEHNKTAETPKNTIVKKPAPLNITRDNITTSTEKINIEVKKPIRRPPPVGTLFRKRLQPTPHTSTESAKIVEEQTTVSKENELAELKLYTESPLELQKVGAVKLNEIPPTSKINTHKLLKENNVHEKDLSDSSLYKKDDLRIKSTPTPTSTPAKHTQTSGTHIAYTPNIDLIIDYTSSTRKPTTTSTEHSIRVVTSEDESLNTISTSHNSEPGKSSGEDEAVRINLEIPQVKDDILIFLKSKAESNKLSKILQSRNMTLNELIDHRERGSSQLHLAEIFKSEPKPIPENNFDLSPVKTTQAPVNVLGSFPNAISQQVLPKEERREPKFLFDSLPQFPMQAEASQTYYTTKRLPELHYTRTRPLLPNAKLTPFYGSSEELLLSYTSSTGRPQLYGNDEIVTVREHDGNKRIPSELKSVITISGAIIAFAVLGFFVLLISCKVRHRKAQKFIKHGMLREHMREQTIRSSTRSDTPVVKNGYYAGCDHTSDTSSTARQHYLWKTIRKTFRYE
ncbi:hypothetical protein M8J76_005848 [Diaphorina citri]|nr:hypothetical protein M8J75_015965 [Diaphorina citri]KAI5732937.1 hypothetical protein M8J76_005848 [Diaphorina citri]KAI5739875.1 hypothetical protein M8J77_024439 [Diaphorina citri]